MPATRNSTALQRQASASRGPLLRRPTAASVTRDVDASTAPVKRRLILRLSPEPTSTPTTSTLGAPIQLAQPVLTAEQRRRQRAEGQKRKIASAKAAKAVDDLATLLAGNTSLGTARVPDHITFYNALLAQREDIVLKEQINRDFAEMESAFYRGREQMACEMLERFTFRAEERNGEEEEEMEADLEMTDGSSEASEEEVRTPPVSPAFVYAF